MGCALHIYFIANYKIFYAKLWSMWQFFKSIYKQFHANNSCHNSNFIRYQIWVVRNKHEVLKNSKTKKLFHECWSICQEPAYNCNKIKQSISDFLYDKMFSFISLSLQMKPCYLHGSRKVIHDYTQSLINVTWFIHQQFLKH